MKVDKGLEKIQHIMAKKQQSGHSTGQVKKPPAYQWQELALRVIEELSIPNFKRNAVFKVCQEKPKYIIEKALNDTKELCQTGEKWKYFFKVTGQKYSSEVDQPGVG